MLLMIHLIFILLFAVLGIVFLTGHGSFLIAGYNTMSKAEQAKYDVPALCRAMSKFMFTLAGCWAVIALSAVINSMIPLWIGFGLFLFVIVAGVVYMNTGGRFLKK